MKFYARELYPDAYRDGFSGIFADTLAQPLPEYNDYFSEWENIMKTHGALNRMGFYQVKRVLRMTWIECPTLGLSIQVIWDFVIK